MKVFREAGSGLHSMLLSCGENCNSCLTLCHCFVLCYSCGFVSSPFHILSLVPVPHLPTPHAILSPAAYLCITFRIPSAPFTCFARSLPSSFHVPFQPRLLEHQLQTQRRSYDSEVEGLRGELQSVKEENNRQQQLLAQNLQLPPEARIEASLQHEITRLTNENLVRCNRCTDAYKLKRRNSEQTKEKKFTLSETRPHHFFVPVKSMFHSNIHIDIFKLDKTYAH